jgi:hypothetical protein
VLLSVVCGVGASVDVVAMVRDGRRAALAGSEVSGGAVSAAIRSAAVRCVSPPAAWPLQSEMRSARPCAMAASRRAPMTHPCAGYGSRSVPCNSSCSRLRMPRAKRPV